MMATVLGRPNIHSRGASMDVFFQGRKGRQIRVLRSFVSGVGCEITILEVQMILTPGIHEGER